MERSSSNLPARYRHARQTPSNAMLQPCRDRFEGLFLTYESRHGIPRRDRLQRFSQDPASLPAERRACHENTRATLHHKSQPCLRRYRQFHGGHGRVPQLPGRRVVRGHAPGSQLGSARPHGVQFRLAIDRGRARREGRRLPGRRGPCAGVPVTSQEPHEGEGRSRRAGRVSRPRRQRWRPNC